jgi:hypothetical protein
MIGEDIYFANQPIRHGFSPAVLALCRHRRGSFYKGLLEHEGRQASPPQPSDQFRDIESTFRDYLDLS